MWGDQSSDLRRCCKYEVFAVSSTFLCIAAGTESSVTCSLLNDEQSVLFQPPASPTCRAAAWMRCCLECGVEHKSSEPALSQLWKAPRAEAAPSALCHASLMAASRC